MSHVLGFQKWVGAEVTSLIYRFFLTIDVVMEVGDCLKAENVKQLPSKVGAQQACLHIKR